MLQKSSVAVAISLGGHAAITQSLISDRELYDKAHLFVKSGS